MTAQQSLAAAEHNLSIHRATAPANPHGTDGLAHGSMIAHYERAVTEARKAVDAFTTAMQITVTAGNDQPLIVVHSDTDVRVMSIGQLIEANWKRPASETSPRVYIPADEDVDRVIVESWFDHSTPHPNGFGVRSTWHMRIIHNGRTVARAVLTPGITLAEVTS